MSADALRSIRTLFLSSLFILAVWLLTWPTAIAKLERYQQLRDLHAWLALRELIVSESWPIFETDPEEQLSAIVREEHDREGFGDTYEVQVPLKVTMLWPSVGEAAFSLVPDPTVFASPAPDTTRAYRVVSSSEEPFANYMIFFVRDKTAVIPLSRRLEFHVDGGAFRILEARLVQYSAPTYWPQLAPHLANQGFVESPMQLQRNSPALAKFQAQVDPRLAGDVKIFGLSLSIAMFFSTVGLLLAGVSFFLLGPLAALRSTREVATRIPWIFVTPTGAGWLGRSFDVLLTGLGFLWAAIPLIVLYLQVTSGVVVEGLERWGLWAGSLGLIFSSAVYVATTVILRGIRRRPAD